LTDLKEKAQKNEQILLETSEQFNIYKSQSETKTIEFNGQIQVVYNEKNELAAQFEETTLKVASFNQILTETEASSEKHMSLLARLSSLEVERDSLSKGKHF
jgi:uncharacterized protein (DUF2344 family)